jgi:hypothetical protein
MSNGILFLSEIGLSLIVSLFLIYWFTPLLKVVLVETCGKQNRADFWVRYTQFMLVISPLLIVVFLSKAPESLSSDMVLLVQDTLFRILMGIFIALLAIGKVIWRSITNLGVFDQHSDQEESDSSEAV